MLLIIISPAVKLGFTARGWIGYVIILIQAMVVVMVLFILLAKVVEVLFRLFAKVEFDESRSRSAGGLFGAFRKKGVLGFKRQPTQRRRRTRGDASTAPRPSAATDLSDRHSRHFVEQEANFAAMQRERSSMSASQRPMPGRFLAQDDVDDEYIMSAFASRRTSVAYGNGTRSSGYVPPGSYSAPLGHQGSSTGFQVVRGGRTTDESPYSMANAAYRDQLPPGAAGRPLASPGMSTQGLPSPATQTSSLLERPGAHRARAASQSAIVEYFAQDGVDSPVAGTNDRQSAYFAFGNTEKENRRLSAPLPTSPAPSTHASPRRPTSMSGATAPTWQREPSGGSGFFSSLFKASAPKTTTDDDWTDSDDSDDEHQKIKRRWPFSRKKGRTSNTVGEVGEAEEEALEEGGSYEDADVVPEEEGAPSKGFVVLRPPPRAAPNSGSGNSAKQADAT